VDDLEDDKLELDDTVLQDDASDDASDEAIDNATDDGRDDE
jgi:hypothetical protein